MTGTVPLFRCKFAAAIVVMLAVLGACAQRTPEVTREVLGLDASGRPLVSFTECDRYGLAGNLGGCYRETPPVVWCYKSLANHNCYRAPDQMATSDPSPIVDMPVLPTPTPPAAATPAVLPDAAISAQPGDPSAAPQ